MIPRSQTPGIVYLLHFERPVGRSSHYIGFTTPHRLTQRLIEHQQGFGARLTRLACNRKIGFTCVRVWPEATFEKERQLKRSGHHDQKCPICRPDVKAATPSLDQAHYPPVFVRPTWTPASWAAIEPPS